MRRLRVLALMHPELVPPDDAAERDEKERFVWKTEWDVCRTLRDIGHEVKALGVQDELLPIRDAVEELKPHIVLSLLELLRVPYTGCNPRGMIISREKALSKKLLIYHRIRVPAFHVFPFGRKARRPKTLELPLFVKSLTDHASLGIAQASLVKSDEELTERVAFVHRRLGSDAIAEQFIQGREIYIGVIGNDRLTALPPRELVFENAPDGAPLIATARAKHDLDYQKRHGIDQRAAQDLPDGVAAGLEHLAKRIYRTLELTGYARLDFRLRPDGSLYFLEANPNPEIALGEEFASAAAAAGLEYPDLLQRIINLGMRGTAPE
jgi:D-alanine-D-alanine ligase